MTINHREQLRHFFRCVQHRKWCVSHRRADVFLMTYLMFYIPLKYISHSGLFHIFFIAVKMFTTSFRWYFLHDIRCVFYTTKTYRTRHMWTNCSPHYLSMKIPQKSCFVHPTPSHFILGQYSAFISFVIIHSSFSIDSHISLPDKYILLKDMTDTYQMPMLTSSIRVWW